MRKRRTLLPIAAISIILLTVTGITPSQASDIDLPYLAASPTEITFSRLYDFISQFFKKEGEKEEEKEPAEELASVTITFESFVRDDDEAEQETVVKADGEVEFVGEQSERIDMDQDMVQQIVSSAQEDEEGIPESVDGATREAEGDTEDGEPKLPGQFKLECISDATITFTGDDMLSSSNEAASEIAMMFPVYAGKTIMLTNQSGFRTEINISSGDDALLFGISKYAAKDITFSLSDEEELAVDIYLTGFELKNKEFTFNIAISQAFGPVYTTDNLRLDPVPWGFGRNPDGYIDEAGYIIIPGAYTDTLSFSEGVAAVALNMNGVWTWGYIDKQGNYTISPQFSQGGFFSNGTVQTGNSFIDHSGNAAIPLVFNEVPLNALQTVTVSSDITITETGNSEALDSGFDVKVDGFPNYSNQGGNCFGVSFLTRLWYIHHTQSPWKEIYGTERFSEAMGAYDNRKTDEWKDDRDRRKKEAEANSMTDEVNAIRMEQAPNSEELEKKFGELAHELTIDWNRDCLSYGKKGILSDSRSYRLLELSLAVGKPGMTDGWHSDRSGGHTTLAYRIDKYQIGPRQDLMARVALYDPNCPGDPDRCVFYNGIYKELTPPFDIADGWFRYYYNSMVFIRESIVYDRIGSVKIESMITYEAYGDAGRACTITAYNVLMSMMDPMGLIQGAATAVDDTVTVLVSGMLPF